MRFFFLIFVFSVLFEPVVWGQNEDCNQARRLYSKGVRSNDFRERAKIFGKATRLCPGDANSHNNLADALEQLGRFKEAEKHYRDASLLNPNLAVAYFGLGDVLGKMEKYRMAIFAYRKGLQLKPDDDLARKGLAKARSKLPVDHSLRLIDSDEISWSLKKENSFAIKLYFKIGARKINKQIRRQLEEIAKILSIVKNIKDGFRIEIISERTDRRNEKDANNRYAKLIVGFLKKKTGSLKDRFQTSVVRVPAGTIEKEFLPVTLIVELQIPGPGRLRGVPRTMGIQRGGRGSIRKPPPIAGTPGHEPQEKKESQ